MVVVVAVNDDEGDVRAGCSHPTAATTAQSTH